MKGPRGQQGDEGRVEGPEEGLDRARSGEEGLDLVGDRSSLTGEHSKSSTLFLSLGGDLVRLGDVSLAGGASLEGDGARDRVRRPKSHHAAPSPPSLSFVAGEILPDRRQFQESARRWWWPDVSMARNLAAHGRRHSRVAPVPQGRRPLTPMGHGPTRPRPQF